MYAREAAAVSDPLRLRDGSLAPVYLFYGDEPELARQQVDLLRTAVLEDAMRDFNHERFSGRELDGIGSVLEACAQVPLLAKLRMVELADPELVGKARAEADTANVKELLAYVGNPNPTTVLLLTSTGIDGRSKIVTAVKKAGIVLKFEGLKRDRDGHDFVKQQADRMGIAIPRDAVVRLVERVGTHPSALLAALERANLHAGCGRVTVGDVDAVAGEGREAVIFELTDAVGLGQRDLALRVLSELFRENPGGEIAQANATLAMLIRQVRLVWLSKAAGTRPDRIQELAGVPPFVANKLAEQARRFDEARLYRAFAGLARLDRDLKGGAASVVRAPKIALQRWVLEVCDGLPGCAPRV